MENSSINTFFEKIDKNIKDFEIEKIPKKNKSKNNGVIYTPKQIVEYIVSNVFNLHFDEYYDLLKLPQIKALKRFLTNNPNLKNRLDNKIKSIKILDPACGSGRFLVAIADLLYEVNRVLHPNIRDYEIRKRIIQNNLYGVEIEKKAYIISKLRLFSWLFSTDKSHLKFLPPNPNDLEVDDIPNYIEQSEVKFNLFNVDFLIDFISEDFDLVIGNPPYIENKKLKNIEYKKRLVNRYKFAYRLFDISIIFIERALELLKRKNGSLSMIIPNKILAADYGIKIRKFLINNTELKEIVDISSLPVFGKTATYPIILSLKYVTPKYMNSIIVRRYDKMIDLTCKNKEKLNVLPQKLIHKIPTFVFPIKGNINLINYIYEIFKPFSEVVKDLKIIYRPFGFINWAKNLNAVSKNRHSDEDLVLLGTGNVGKYYINFEKPIKIAGKTLNISYFNFQENLGKYWKDLKKKKLIFREIAKEMTWVYDSGIYANLTGLYFVRIPSFNENKLFSLLAIMNSNIMDKIFKILYSSLHLAGGYLRFNGSFIKRLPIPDTFPFSLSMTGKILQILTQLKFDLDCENLNLKLEEFNLKKKYMNEIANLISFFSNLNNALVKLMYLDDCFLKSNIDYSVVREFLFSKFTNKIPFKYLLPRFNVPNYEFFQLSELESVLMTIKKFYNTIINDKVLVNQFNDILFKDCFHLSKN